MSFIPNQLRDFRFCLIRRGEKSPFEKEWSSTANYAFDDPILRRHLEAGGNYGVLADDEHVIVESDSPKVNAAVEKYLPPTFTVSTPGHEDGRHYYFICHKFGKSLPLIEDNDPERNLGHITARGRQVVGPGSIHPNGKPYVVLRDLPIATVTAEQIREALVDFIKHDEPEEDVHEKEQIKKAGLDFQINILDVVPVANLKKQGDELFGPHPVHGSETGRNFWVHPSKNVWKCFRCDSGGGPLTWLAVQEGIISCDEARPGRLKGEKFKKVLKIAEEKGLIKTEFKKSPSVEFELVNGYRLTIERMRSGKYKAVLSNSGNLVFGYELPESFWLGKWTSRKCGFFKKLQSAVNASPDELEKKLNEISAKILANPQILGELKTSDEHVETDFEKAMKLLEPITKELFIEESDVEPYITLQINSGESHLENLSLRSEAFDAFVNTLFFNHEGRGLRPEIRADVKSTLEAKARSDGVSKRLEMLGWVDEANYRILIDLGDPRWRAIEIDEKGWRIITPSSNPFKRTRLTMPLPEPIMVDNPREILEKLVPFNIDEGQCENVRKVLPIWIASVPLTSIPRPGLAFIGAHGSGKTVLHRRIQQIFTGMDVQSLHASDVRDVVVKLWSSPLVGFDNVRTIPAEIADLLSSSITGSQHVSRLLYTNSEVQVIQLRRAIGINGIVPNLTRYADLTDRFILVKLRRLEGNERKEEVELQKEFCELHPKILGAVCSALSAGVKQLREVREELSNVELPRMADWAIWGEAIARGLGYRKLEFLNAYLALVSESVITVLEENPLGRALLILAEELEKEKMELPQEVSEKSLPVKAKNYFEGTPTQLQSELERLIQAQGEAVADWYAEGFPKTAKSLGKQIRELVPNLVERGIKVIFKRLPGGTRSIAIKVVEPKEQSCDNSDVCDISSFLLTPNPEMGVCGRRVEDTHTGEGEGNNKNKMSQTPQNVTTPADPIFKLRQKFGIQPFKPSEISPLFTDEELPEVSRRLDEALSSGELEIVTRGEDGATCFRFKEVSP